MSVVEVSLLIIAICSVVNTIILVGVGIFILRFLKESQKLPQTVNRELLPAVKNLKNTLNAVSETFGIFKDIASIRRRFKKKDENKH